jgi:hypothetical protein
MKGGKRKGKGGRKSRKLSPGARAWNQHVMKTFNEMRKKNRDYKFKDALKAAARTFKK